MLALIPFLAVAMQTKTPGAFVEVSATPSVALIGQPVVIAGETGYHEKTKTATIAIRHESGTPSATLKAPVTPQGKFSITFTDTKKAGKYTVDVTSPDGKGKGAAAFKVAPIGGLAEEVEQAFLQLEDRGVRLLQVAREIAVALPSSKERDDVINKILEIENKERTINLPPVLILGELKKIQEQQNVVNLDEIKIFGELQEWIEEADETTDEIDRSGILKRSKDNVCETINTAIEGCKFAAFAFNVGKNGLDTLRKCMLDKGIPSIVNSAVGEGGLSLSISSGVKAGAAQMEGDFGVLTSIPGLVLDVVEFFTKELFNRYCVTYRGPFKAKMTMVWNEGSKPWMKYTVFLEGRISFRFQKQNAPGQPIPMTGEVEGNAVKHEFWENVFVVEPLPPTITLLAREWLAPPSFPVAVESPVDIGAIANMSTPASFNVPFGAQMDGDRITLAFKPARSDFSDVMAHRTLIVVFTGLMPDFTVFKVPIQPAFWILTKGFGDTFNVDVQKDATGNRFVAKTFTAHRETSDKGVVVDWQISFDTSKKFVKDLGD